MNFTSCSCYATRVYPPKTLGRVFVITTITNRRMTLPNYRNENNMVTALTDLDTLARFNVPDDHVHTGNRLGNFAFY